VRWLRLIRGYYYDVETGLYYCQSRYYNHQWDRWISADVLGVELSVGWPPKIYLEISIGFGDYNLFVSAEIDLLNYTSISIGLNYIKLKTIVTCRLLCPLAGIL
jgi:hypothetical protein